MVGEEGADASANGRILEASWIVERRPGASMGAPGGGQDSDGWVRVVDRNGAMIAAGEMVPGGLVQPRIVLR